jgi:peptidyl-prolyl cis-trans isomerase C
MSGSTGAGRSGDATAASTSTVAVNGVDVDVAAFGSAGSAAAHELLRQRAVALGLVGVDDDAAGVEAGIERLLEREVAVPQPGDAECRRFYEAHPDLFVSGELAAACHILFAVTPGTPVTALRARAEAVLADLLRAPDRFDAAARENSNCPSGMHGGNLGQLQRGDSVPEFDQVLFSGTWTGIHAQLVKTRFGFHILRVDRRAPGRQVPYEAARDRIAERLREGVLERALGQYVRVLAGQAELRGVDLGAVATPLVQ